MKVFLFFLVLLFVFILFSFSYFSLFLIYLKYYQKKDIDKRIKETLFKELHFIHRQTTNGKHFLIIEHYNKNKAIQL